MCWGVLLASTVSDWGSASAAPTITTVAGNGAQSYSGDGGPATSAALNLPRGVAIDAAGNLYVADASNHRIRRVAAGTGIITTVAGGAGYGYSDDGGPATGASLFYPHDVAVDSAGNLYIADIENSRVRRVDGTTGVITTVAGTGSAGYSGDGGMATAARLNAPEGVAVDRNGHVYIADMVEQRVRRVDLQTGMITTVAGNGTAGYCGDGGPATSANLWGAVALAVGTDGSLYIGDSANHRVRRVDPTTGAITTIAGNGIAGFSGDGGPATSASLMGPHGVAVDPTGGLYIADNGNGRVRRVDLQTGVIATIAGNGVGGYVGDGGPATDASFQGPYGITVDSDGNVYVGDPGNHRVRKVTAPDGAAGGTPDLQISGRICYTAQAFYSRWSIGVGRIVAANPDGTSPVPLSDNPAGDYYPSWSPDGAAIVFQSDGPVQDLWVMNADGTNPDFHGAPWN
jgi:sugar lactone lactonase YvrE